MYWRTRVSAIGAAVVTILATGVGVASAVPGADREVTFSADGTTVSGTLHVPAHRPHARLAAALLLPGSGPSDRDGDQPPKFTPDTLRLVAEAFGDDGVMTLRFDKYFSGRTGPGTFPPGAIDMAAFTRQAVAAYDTLAAQPEADPGRLAIAGHSEGGLQALLVAREARIAPAGLALLAPQDLHMLDMVRFQLDDQIDEAVRQGLFPAVQGETNKAVLSRLISSLRAGRPLDYTGMTPTLASVLQSLFNPLNIRFLRTDDAIYPPDAARQIRRGTRVLVTCGTADVQVPCWTTPPLLGALRHTAGPGLVVLPGADHELHPPGTPTNAKILVPSVLHALRAFALELSSPRFPA